MNKNCLFVHAHERDKAIFFSSVSNYLSTQGYESIHLTFSRLEEAVYTAHNVKKPYFLPKVLKTFSSELNEDDKKNYDLEKLLYYTFEFNKINHFSYNKQELLINAKRYINFLNKLNSDKKLELIISWNDTFMFDSISKRFAQVNNIPVLIFEAGIFRPYTITVDGKGVNYGNSVPQEMSAYKDVQFHMNDYQEFLSSIKDKQHIFQSQTKNVGDTYLKERLVDYVNRNIFKRELKLEVIFEKPTNKIKRVISNKRKNNKNNIHTKDSELPKDYLFVPFQVHDDSQIIMNSDSIKNMEQLVEIIIFQLDEYNRKHNKDLHVVFKEHPADQGRVNYSSLYDKFKNHTHVNFLTSGNTNEILQKSNLVVTINSTVGIEALQSYKPVITLGNSYYGIDGIAYKCSNYKNLYEVFHKALTQDVDREAINKFLFYLRFSYQIEGDWRKGIFNAKELQDKINAVLA
ncbi:capsular polysaccharide export protein, LipB/KpsS family [Priestia sp. LL-8]|uniref:capsular polysaccharide export protein, LipB/KpsS family n=1 Tax=Priestia sp. LL-8 TaxID=3110068 RepID=UPI002E273412|nr:hypothetical protein [Priestia sp. LL-8]